MKVSSVQGFRVQEGQLLNVRGSGVQSSGKAIFECSVFWGSEFGKDDSACCKKQILTKIYSV
jgi:hypothetical protein